MKKEGEGENNISSPDEISLVKFTEKVGITLYHGSFTTITLLTPMGEEEYEILDIFPFSSERKRMGIILKQKRTRDQVLDEGP